MNIEMMDELLNNQLYDDAEYIKILAELENSIQMNEETMDDLLTIQRDDAQYMKILTELTNSAESMTSLQETTTSQETPMIHTTPTVESNSTIVTIPTLEANPTIGSMPTIGTMPTMQGMTIIQGMHINQGMLTVQPIPTIPSTPIVQAAQIVQCDKLSSGGTYMLDFSKSVKKPILYMVKEKRAKSRRGSIQSSTCKRVTHTCDTCGDTFKKKQCLDRHRRKHEVNEVYECEFCGRRVQSEDKLLLHLWSKHRPKEQQV